MQHQDTPPSSSHLQHCPPGAAGRPDAPLFCTSGLLHVSPAWTVLPSPSTTGKRPLLLQDAGAPRPVLGVLLHQPLQVGSPPFFPSFCCANAGAPPLSQPSLPAQPGPLRFQMGSGTRVPMGQSLRKFPCWEIAAPTEISLCMRLSWRKSEPRGRGVPPGPAPLLVPLSQDRV